MDFMLRRLKLRKSDPRENDARKNLQENLYEYSKFSGLGFPNKPSALAYDPDLDLLAIGTKSGALRLYGKPGICLQGQHKGDIAVSRIIFQPRQGKLLTFCSDNSLHLWELPVAKDQFSCLEEKKSFITETSKLRTVSSCCLLCPDNNLLLLGTEGGNVHFFSIESFTLLDRVISQERIIHSSTNVNLEEEDAKVGLGAVECICQHPRDKTKVLIGFSCGAIVLWNVNENVSAEIYNSMQTLEHLTFIRGGDEFVSSHADGSYIIWSIADANFPKEPATTPYGPFPCNSITKILWKTTSEDPFIVFTGGMPRASYGDRYTITIMHGDLHIVLDFTSRVLDFVVVSNCDNETSDDDSLRALIVLAEEELVAIDLMSSNWPLFRLPYLVSLHCSVVTSVNHVSNVPEELWKKIINAGSCQFSQFSSRDWPINGGKILKPTSNMRNLLLTGHEDGSVNFWDVSLDGAIQLLYKLNTANLFGIDTSMHYDGSGDSEDYNEWPPFRKVGMFDPFTDDPRLAVRKIHFCLLSETLTVAGTAGQVITFQYEREEREQDIRIATMNIITDQENFTWRGHNALEVKNCQSKLASGFQPICVVQMMPPVPCTALALQSEWQLLSIGTAYGVGLYDYARFKVVYTKCTITSSDGGGEGVTLSRRKSFQKMLRQSLRRLRRQTSEVHRPSSEHDRSLEVENKAPMQPPCVTDQGDTRRSVLRSSQKKDTTASTSSTLASLPAGTTGSIRSSQTLASVVRCLHFAQVFLLNTQVCSSSLWVGTNHGSVYIFQLTIPSNDRRTQDTVQCILAKEIRLRHGAPVVSIQALDHAGQPLPAPLEVQHERAKAPDMNGSHYVMICSQQQLKVFTLPNLKPYQKYKFITHRPDVQLSNIVYASFRSKKDETYIETNALSLSIDGEVCVFTIPQLRYQLSRSIIPKENISGINGCVFTPNGMGYFLCSPSELERFSLSAHFPSAVVCSVELSQTQEQGQRLTDQPVIDGSIVQDRHTDNVQDANGASQNLEENRLNHQDQEYGSRSQNEPNTGGVIDENLADTESSLQQGHTNENTAADEICTMPVGCVAETGANNTDSSTVLRTSEVTSRAGSVTCASVISIPFSTKVVKAEVHDPPVKETSSEFIDSQALKELNKLLFSATVETTGKC